MFSRIWKAIQVILETPTGSYIKWQNVFLYILHQLHRINLKLTVKELNQDLNFRKFIKDYSAIAKPLTNVTWKAARQWEIKENTLSTT